MARRPITYSLQPASTALKTIAPDHQVAAGTIVFEMLSSDFSFPSGWVLLAGRLNLRGHGGTARLFYEIGHGDNNTSVIALPISLKGTIHELIWLPPGIKGLRWEVSPSSGEFEQSPLVITEVGPLAQIWIMVRRIVPTLFKHSRKKRARVRLTFWRMIFDLRGAYKAAGMFRARASAPDYQTWIERFDSLNAEDRGLICKRAAKLKNISVFSLWLPVSGKSPETLAATVESVKQQLYPHWELLIALDSTCDTETRRIAEDMATGDHRLRVHSDVTPDLIRGNYLALLNPNDLLPEHALFCLAAEINAHPDAGMVYTDEDCIDDAGVRSRPCFKPDWNLTLLRAGNYTGGLCVWRRDLLPTSGEDMGRLLRANGYGLALSAAERLAPGQIRHLPFILYHRRNQEPAIGIEKTVLEEHLSRIGVSATVVPMAGNSGCLIRYALPDPAPLVSVIIPTRDGRDLLRRCIDSVRNLSSYPRYEIVVVDNQSSDPATLHYLEELARTPGVSVLRYDQPFNYSAINNFAARHAQGKVLCLLNNDTEVISPDWLEEMVGHLCQKQVGVVGVKLLYPDGRVQHGGDVVGVGGCANHLHSMIGRNEPGYCNRALLAQDLSAVTAACLVTWRELYLELGGLNAHDLPVTFNDVDYCLRVREAGQRVVWTPHAELYHHESASRGHDKTPEQSRRAAAEVKYKRRRWKKMMNHDSAYNPNLSQERADFSLSHAPLTTPPWLK